MKIKLLLTFICGLIFSVSSFSENIRLENGTEYKNVTVLESDGISVMVEHDNGTSRIKYSMMSPDLKQKYGYSAEKEQQYYQKAAADKQSQAEERLKKAEAERKKAEEKQALIAKLNNDVAMFLENGSLCVFKSTFYTDVNGRQCHNKEGCILAIEYENNLLLENGNFVRGGFYVAEPVVKYLAPRRERFDRELKVALQNAKDSIRNYDDYVKTRQLRLAMIDNYNKMVEANRKVLSERRQYEVTTYTNSSNAAVTTPLRSQDYNSLNNIYAKANADAGTTGTSNGASSSYIVETTPLPYSFGYMQNEYNKIYRICNTMTQYGDSVKKNLSSLGQILETLGGLKMNAAYAAMMKFHITGKFGAYQTNKPCIKTADLNMIKEIDQLYNNSDVQGTFSNLSKINQDVITQENASPVMNTP